MEQTLNQVESAIRRRFVPDSFRESAGARRARTVSRPDTIPIEHCASPPALKPLFVSGMAGMLKLRAQGAAECCGAVKPKGRFPIR